MNSHSEKRLDATPFGEELAHAAARLLKVRQAGDDVTPMLKERYG